MKWPTANGTSKKSDVSELLKRLSDERLRWLVIRTSSEADSNMVLVSTLASVRATAEKHANFFALAELRAQGPLHDEAEAVYRRLRFRALLHVARTAHRSPMFAEMSPELDHTVPIGEWLKARWESADKTIRSALQAVATGVGVSLPMTRRRKPHGGPKDSPSNRRTEPDQHPNPAEPIQHESPAETEPKKHENHDRPQWHDDDADGWKPCTSLHDALHPDERGWY